jgi:DinB superfamily
MTVRFFSRKVLILKMSKRTGIGFRSGCRCMAKSTIGIKKISGRKNYQLKFNIIKSRKILERTPSVLRSLLENLDDEWAMNNEGPETFSPFDVIGHLIHGEKTDWRERTNMILEYGISKSFVPFDRFAQYEASKGKILEQLLNEFEILRKENMLWLRSLKLSESDLDKKGVHPVLGQVTLRQLLSTWVVHDLTHIAQITRVMAKQYKEEIGPWTEFFRILNF